MYKEVQTLNVTSMDFCNFIKIIICTKLTRVLLLMIYLEVYNQGKAKGIQLTVLL